MDEAKEFENTVRRFLSELWGLQLEERTVHLTATAKKKFDLVSQNQKYVGDAKYLKNIKTPAAKWSGIAEYVWLLEKVNTDHKFLVFGKDKEVAARWLNRYGSLISDIKFYFFDGTTLEKLN